MAGSIQRLERIWLIGCPGSGKSTLGRELERRLQVPLHELDGLFHQANWVPLPDDEFYRRVAEVTAGDRWILDGNYMERTRNLPAQRVQTIIWLDFGRLRTFSRVLRRSLRRVLTRKKLWNGNRESWKALFHPNPEENIVLWSWKQHPIYRQRYEAVIREGGFHGAQVLRFRSPRDLEEWLDALRVSCDLQPAG